MLTLDKDHIYRYNNRVVPGTTSVIQNYFGERPYWSEWHANRGTAIHKAIHYLIESRLDWSTVDPRILDRVKAFEKFLVESGYVVVHSEISLFSKIYRFAGTIDLILWDDANDRYILGDIKSSIEPVVDLQLGAYSILWNENNKEKPIRTACAIELKANGDYKFHWVKNLRRAQNIFLACLTLSNWKKENY